MGHTGAGTGCDCRNSARPARYSRDDQGSCRLAEQGPGPLSLRIGIRDARSHVDHLPDKRLLTTTVPACLRHEYGSMTASRQGGSELFRMCRDSGTRAPEALQAQPRPVVSAAPVDVPVTPRPVRRFCDLRSIRWVSLPPRPDQQPIDDRAPPSRPARRQESRRHLDADVKERPGGGAAFVGLPPHPKVPALPRPRRSR